MGPAGNAMQSNKMKWGERLNTAHLASVFSRSAAVGLLLSSAAPPIRSSDAAASSSSTTSLPRQVGIW